MKPRQQSFWPTWSVNDSGFSRGAWASVAVKSLRLGWPNGLRESAKHLDKSYMRLVLLCGTFEDIFPAGAELADVRAEIKVYDYEALCQRETHHGRGYTGAFCDLEKEAVRAARGPRSEIYAQAKRWGVWIPPRALNTFYTWCRIGPADPGVTRKPDWTPWRRMPIAMLDGHTPEGKAAGRRVTVLSGHYENHRLLAELVSNRGWDYVRYIVHSEEGGEDE